MKSAHLIFYPALAKMFHGWVRFFKIDGIQLWSTVYQNWPEDNNIYHWPEGPVLCITPFKHILFPTYSTDSLL